MNDPNKNQSATGRSGFGQGFAKPVPKAETQAQPAATQVAPTTNTAVQPPLNTPLAQGNQAARNSVQAMLATQFKAIQSIIPKHLDPQRLARIALIEFQKNPKLMECSPQSVVGCVLQSAILGLELGGSLGYCYMVPYKGVAQFQVGYKGLIKLARNSGEIKHIDAGIICQNDDYSFEHGFEPKCSVRFKFGEERGQVIGYYACASFINGGTAFEVMTKEEVRKFAQAKSKTFANGPWQTDFDAMAIKTVVKRLSKWLPITESMANAITSDEKVLTDKVDLDVGMVVADAQEIEHVDTETGEVTQ